MRYILEVMNRNTMQIALEDLLRLGCLRPQGGADIELAGVEG